MAEIKREDFEWQGLRLRYKPTGIMLYQLDGHAVTEHASWGSESGVKAHPQLLEIEKVAMQLFREKRTIGLTVP